MTPVRRLTICAVTLVWLLPAFVQDTPSALIVSAGNSWSLNGKNITRGKTLPPGSKLQESPTQTELVLGCDTAGWLSYTCKNRPCVITACQLKIPEGTVQRVDPQPTDGPASPASQENWFSSLFKREPATLAVLGVREGGHVSDAIVRQAGAEVHLAPALMRVLEGKYCFRFTPLPPGNPSLTRTATINWDRSTDAEGVVSLPGLPAGLYTLDKSDSEAGGSCTFQPDPTPPWILVTPDPAFTAVTTQWKDYLTQMREIERQGASPTVLLTVRHATLAHLADSLAGSK